MSWASHYKAVMRYFHYKKQGRDNAIVIIKSIMQPAHRRNRRIQRVHYSLEPCCCAALIFRHAGQYHFLFGNCLRRRQAMWYRRMLHPVLVHSTMSPSFSCMHVQHIADCSGSVVNDLVKHLPTSSGSTPSLKNSVTAATMSAMNCMSGAIRIMTHSPSFHTTKSQ